MEGGCEQTFKSPWESLSPRWSHNPEIYNFAFTYSSFMIFLLWWHIPSACRHLLLPTSRLVFIAHPIKLIGCCFSFRVFSECAWFSIHSLSFATEHPLQLGTLSQWEDFHWEQPWDILWIDSSCSSPPLFFSLFFSQFRGNSFPCGFIYFHSQKNGYLPVQLY